MLELGLKNDLITEAKKLPVDTRGEPRQRTYTESELKLMFDQIKPNEFNRFVRFAYYTGARSGEIRSIPAENILDGSLSVIGKKWEENHQTKHTSARHIIKSR